MGVAFGDIQAMLMTVNEPRDDTLAASSGAAQTRIVADMPNAWSTGTAQTSINR
jgi:hypothetical protein